MHILVLAPYYWPDAGAASTQFTVLCEQLVQRGHAVSVIAGVPHYPSGKVPPPYRRCRVFTQVINGVQILRVPLPSIDRSRMPLRLLQFIAYQIGASFVGRHIPYDALMMYGPSLEVWLPCVSLGVWQGRPILYSVHDLYPEVGIKLGIFRNKALIYFVSMLENYCLHHAHQIRILSSSFLDNLLSRGISQERIHLIYDWVDPQTIIPLPKGNKFSIEHGLERRFVVLYTGNLGFVQGLESLVSAAGLLSDHPEIMITFVGEGAARASLEILVKEKNIQNVRFIDWQPVERMSEIYASADVSLVSLNKGIAFDALPSKTYAILSSERPLIAAVDPGSDAWALVERAGAGICVPPQDPAALADAVIRLKQDSHLREQFARNGRAYVLEHHSPDKAAGAFEKLLEMALAEIP